VDDRTSTFLLAKDLHRKLAQLLPAHLTVHGVERELRRISEHLVYAPEEPSRVLNIPVERLGQRVEPLRLLAECVQPAGDASFAPSEPFSGPAQTGR
jgi:hypothetical protein